MFLVLIVRDYLAATVILTLVVFRWVEIVLVLGDLKNGLKAFVYLGARFGRNVAFEACLDTFPKGVVDIAVVIVEPNRNRRSHHLLFCLARLPFAIVLSRLDLFNLNGISSDPNSGCRFSHDVSVVN